MDPLLVQEMTLFHNRICQALGDPTRLMLLYALHNHEKNVTELAEELSMPQPTVSRHLKVLRERDLVTTRREGVAVYYALADVRVMDALEILRMVLHDRVTADAQLAKFDALETRLGGSESE